MPETKRTRSANGGSSIYLGKDGYWHGRVTVGVDGHADEAARKLPLELVPDADIAGLPAAVAHRHAETLRRADGNVGAELAGRGEQRQRKQIGGDDRQRALLMQRCYGRKSGDRRWISWTSWRLIFWQSPSSKSNN